MEKHDWGDTYDAHMGTLKDHAEHVRRVIAEEGTPVLGAAFDGLMNRIWKEIALADSKVREIQDEIVGGLRR